MPLNTCQNSRRKKTCILSFIILALSTNMVCAAPTSRTDIEEQNRKARQEEQARKQREQAQDVFLQKEKQDTKLEKLPEETPNFMIHTIKLEGNPEGRFSWAQDIANHYLDQRIGWQGINIIVKALTNAFIDKGYVTTRVLIPQQDISTGVLTLQVIPGKIKDIKFSDPATKADWRSAFPARPGDILNLRDLEQGLEQMKRVPSQDAEMQLVPGENPGESIVQITVKQKQPWKVVVSLDDSGSKATGKLQASETFAMDNLFGINDLFNISLNSDAERKGQRYGTRGNSFSYSFPQGYWTYSLSSAEYKYHQTIENMGTSFLTSGRTKNFEFKAERLIYRDKSRKTSLALSITKSLSKSFIEDAEIEVQRRKTTAAEIGLRHKQYNGQTVVDYSLAYKRGVPWMGAQDDPADSGPDEPTTHYNLWIFDINLTTPVNIGKAKGSYSATLRGQYTKDRMYAAEFLSIGNRYTVRGFDGEQTLSSESGWYLRNELSIPVKEAGPEVYLALDVGQISGASAGESIGKSLVGSAVGLRGSLAGTQYDVFVGVPIKRPAGMDIPDHVLGFQMLYQI